MTRLLAVISVLLAGVTVHSQPQKEAAPPVKLEAGKAIIMKGEQFILPKGTIVGKEQVNGAEIEVTSLYLIPAKKGQWEFEIRPVGVAHLRLKPEPGALTGLMVIFAGMRGELAKDSTLSGGILWLAQAYEIRDRTGKLLYKTKAKEE